MHGIHDFGVFWLGDVVHDAPVSAKSAFGGVVGWAVETLGYAIACTLAAAIAVISPLWLAIKKVLPGAVPLRA